MEPVNIQFDPSSLVLINIILAVMMFGVSLDLRLDDFKRIVREPKAPLIGLFAQKGVYGLAAASLVPMLFGVLVQRPLPLWLVFGASLIGLFGHFLLHLGFGMDNPAVSASYAILLSLGYALGGLLWLQFNTRAVKIPQ